MIQDRKFDSADTNVFDISGNKDIKKTTMNPSSTVNITGLFLTRYRGSSFSIESSIILEFIIDVRLYYSSCFCYYSFFVIFIIFIKFK